MSNVIEVFPQKKLKEIDTAPGCGPVEARRLQLVEKEPTSKSSFQLVFW